MKGPLLFASLLLTSCGLLKLFEKTPTPMREVASSSVKEILNESDVAFSGEIKQRLESLHQVYVIGQKSMLEFDQQIESADIEELYTDSSYLKLLAVRAQAEEIEEE